MKSGKNTSEFYQWAVLVIGMVIISCVGIVQKWTPEQIATLLAAFGGPLGLTSVGYSVGRSIVKAKGGNGDENITEGGAS